MNSSRRNSSSSRATESTNQSNGHLIRHGATSAAVACIRACRNPFQAAGEYKRLKAEIKSYSNPKAAYLIAGAMVVTTGLFVAAAVLSKGTAPAVILGVSAGLYAASAAIHGFMGVLQHVQRNREVAAFDRAIEQGRSNDRSDLSQRDGGFRDGNQGRFGNLRGGGYDHYNMESTASEDEYSRASGKDHYDTRKGSTLSEDEYSLLVAQRKAARAAVQRSDTSFRPSPHVGTRSKLAVNFGTGISPPPETNLGRSSRTE